MAYSGLRMKYLLMAGTAALAVAFSASAQVPPPPPEPPRTITVSGEAEAQVTPDRVLLSLSLVSRNKELAQAKQENDGMVKRLVAIAQEFKILKEKIATSGVYISPEYNYNNNKREFIGYTVNRSLRITIDDLAIHERLLAAIVDAGVDQVDGVEFALADKEAQAKSVRVRAVENARDRAESLAAAAGAKLGRVLSISTADTPPPIVPYPRMAMTAEKAASDSVAPSLPGMIALHESVTVSFGLE